MTAPVGSLAVAQQRRQVRGEAWITIIKLDHDIISIQTMSTHTNTKHHLYSRGYPAVFALEVYLLVAWR